MRFEWAYAPQRGAGPGRRVRERCPSVTCVEACGVQFLFFISASSLRRVGLWLRVQRGRAVQRDPRTGGGFVAFDNRTRGSAEPRQLCGRGHPPIPSFFQLNSSPLMKQQGLTALTAEAFSGVRTCMNTTMCSMSARFPARADMVRRRGNAILSFRGNKVYRYGTYSALVA